MTGALLEVRDLSVEIRAGGRSVHPLQGVSLTVGQGDLVGLVGESGSGKSMTVRAILGLLPPGGVVTGGGVWFEGRPLHTAGEKELNAIRGRDIGMIFQDASSALNPVMPVGRQIADVYRHNRGGSRSEAFDRAVRMLADLDIPRPAKVARSYPHQLSGGMCQRVNIAMALVASPRLLLADEPTTGLDLTTQVQVLELMRRSLAEAGASLLLISHDLKVVAELCSSVGVMYAGVMMERGPRDEIFGQPANPYTRALVECSVMHDTDRLPFIPGTVPRVDEPHARCPFLDRCDEKIAVCKEEPLPRKDVGPAHEVRCHL